MKIRTLAGEETFTVFILICVIAKSINTSQTRIEHSDESTRCQVKDSKSQSGEVFVLFDLTNDFVCFEQVSHASLSLLSLEHFHDELKGIE